MKNIIQILIFGFCLSGFCQSIPNAISDHLKKELPKDYRKELKLELNNAFQKSKDQFSINLNTSDTLYLIRGVDIQTRQAYGRIWNDQFSLHYSDNKKPQENKIMASDVKIFNNEKDNVTENFNPIIKCVETGDNDCLQDFAEENKVFSGVTWMIFRVYQKNEKLNVDSYSVPDFDTFK